MQDGQEQANIATSPSARLLMPTDAINRGLFNHQTPQFQGARTSHGHALQEQLKLA